VRDDRVPQMAGAEQVLAALPRDGATTFSGLVLNDRGMQRALAAGVREVHVAVMATEGFSRRNAGMPVDDAIAQATRVLARARAAGVRTTGTVSVAFGCPFEGRVDPAKALAVAEALAAGGAHEIVLADTIGVATPRVVARLVQDTRALGAPVGVHLHDTRNTAMANAMAALTAGATTFETSIGGLGGCPFAPGATGNLATEDLVNLLEAEGVDTGIDLDGLLEVGRWLGERRGRALPGALAAAGRWAPAAVPVRA
jgi:isopropylmalate/homocitrate/citramalate synthase